MLMFVCTEILYGSLITVGLVPATYTSTITTTTTTTDTTNDAAGGGNVLSRHPGFTADSVGYNAETGQSVHLHYTLTAT